MNSPKTQTNKLTLECEELISTIEYEESVKKYNPSVRMNISIRFNVIKSYIEKYKLEIPNLKQLSDLYLVYFNNVIEFNRCSSFITNDGSTRILRGKFESLIHLINDNRAEKNYYRYDEIKFRFSILSKKLLENKMYEECNLLRDSYHLYKSRF